MCAWRIHNFVETLPLRDATQRRAAWLAAHFSESERTELADRHVQSVAGALALKRALVALYHSLPGGSDVTERDFMLSHSDQGAPVVLARPDLEGTAIPAERIRVSISHSRDTACGLAVLIEEDGDSGPIRFDLVDGVARITLDRPPGNTMNAAFFVALSECVARLPDLRVRGLLIHGAGRHFSSGADLAELTQRLSAHPPEVSARLLAQATGTLDAIARLPYPTVAAVSGCCLGSGLELALACRHRVATPGAVFALPEATFGLMPGCGGTVRLPRLVGLGHGLRMILTGCTIAADEARRIGLVDRLVDRRELVAAAIRQMETHATPAETSHAGRSAH